MLVLRDSFLWELGKVLLNNMIKMEQNKQFDIRIHDLSR